MKFWIARDYDGELWVYPRKPILDVDIYKIDFSLEDSSSFELSTNLFPEITFENSPQEIELKLSNFTSKQLTRDYFAKHNWEIIIPEPDENGFVLWEAKWVRSMEEGSPYYSNLSVTNMMHEDRFCVSGKTGEASVEWLMAYTEEDLENILKALAIYDYYKKENENI